MSDYLDRIIPAYATDHPLVRSAITAIVEEEIAERAQDMWQRWQCVKGHKPIQFRTSDYSECPLCAASRSAERAEADAATLREKLVVEQQATLQIAVELATAGSPHDGTVEGVRWLAGRVGALRDALTAVCHGSTLGIDAHALADIARKALTSGDQG